MKSSPGGRETESRARPSSSSPTFSTLPSSNGGYPSNDTNNINDRDVAHFRDELESVRPVWIGEMAGSQFQGSTVGGNDPYLLLEDNAQFTTSPPAPGGASVLGNVEDRDDAENREIGNEYQVRRTSSCPVFCMQPAHRDPHCMICRLYYPRLYMNMRE